MKRKYTKFATLQHRLDHFTNTKGSHYCHEWTGTIDKNTGYGHVKVNNKDALVHRVVYELNHGEIPGGLVVRHKCDNRLCVNPNHLEIGTYGDNTQDALCRGRIPLGEQRKHTKLTEDNIKFIRSSNLKNKKLSEMFGVTTSHISAIKRRVKWAWL